MLPLLQGEKKGSRCIGGSICLKRERRSSQCYVQNKKEWQGTQLTSALQWHYLTTAMVMYWLAVIAWMCLFAWPIRGSGQSCVVLNRNWMGDFWWWEECHSTWLSSTTMTVKSRQVEQTEVWIIQMLCTVCLLLTVFTPVGVEILCGILPTIRLPPQEITHLQDSAIQLRLGCCLWLIFISWLQTIIAYLYYHCEGWARYVWSTFGTLLFCTLQWKDFLSTPVPPPLCILPFTWATADSCRRGSIGGLLLQQQILLAFQSLTRPHQLILHGCSTLP